MSVFTPSLFDVEDVSVDQMPPVREMTVGPVSFRDVQEFAARYHYTHAARNALWRWGLWHGAVLYGVVAYNLPTRSVCESVFGPDHWAHVWHMTRLAMAEHAPHNSESRLIAGSLREIKRLHPGTWAVLSYADIELGHTGFVYQATNAIYTGTGGDPIFHLDQDGNRRGTYLSGNVGVKRAAALGWTRHVGQAKHRYLYLLGSKTQRKNLRRLLRLNEHPYPKPDDVEW